MLTHKDLPVISFATPDEFYTWLSEHNTSQQPFWLRFYKVGSHIPTIPWTDAVDVALCWGWIDGLKNAYDEVSYLIRFTPRRPKSVWSKINVEKVQRLIEEGKMQPSGLTHVASAKSDGRWDAAYSGSARMELPEAFYNQLHGNQKALDFYNSLNKANTYAISYRIATAVGEEKKLRVITKLVQMLEDGKSFH